MTPTRAVGDNATLKRGAEIYPVPDQAPVPVAIVPWPQSVAVSGRRAVPPGLDLRAEGDDAAAAVASFAELVDSLFPVEGIVRPAAEGGLPGLRFNRQRLWCRSLCDPLFADGVAVSGEHRAPGFSTG